jgi:hypothetical protein
VQQVLPVNKEIQVIQDTQAQLAQLGIKETLVTRELQEIQERKAIQAPEAVAEVPPL